MTLAQYVFQQTDSVTTVSVIVAKHFIMSGCGVITIIGFQV